MRDVIGIGIGPFNLGMAALLEDVPEIDGLFFEQKAQFDWHPGMLIDGTTLQVPFFADLVTMANPKSSYSFVNYLQEHDRLYHFYFLEKFHIPRREYNDYCQWTARQLDGCRFGQRVENVIQHTGEGTAYYEVEVRNLKTEQTDVYYSKHLIVGVGTIPATPDAFTGLNEQDVFHSADFLEHKERCLQAKSITVTGSGQSAAEVFLELLKEQESHDFELNWLTRSKGFFPMEYSKLGLEHFSPDYIDYFYRLPQEKRDEALQGQDLLYKGISLDTIADIYDALYEKSIGGREPKVHMQAMTEVTDIRKRHDGEGYQLSLEQWEEGENGCLDSEVVVAATGYKPHIPDCLAGLFDQIRWDPYGRYEVNHDYSLKQKEEGAGTIFVQNGEMHTHGVGAPDLGLGAHRNALIINQLANRSVYPVRRRNVFQQFGMGKGVKEDARN